MQKLYIFFDTAPPLVAVLGAWNREEAKMAIDSGFKLGGSMGLQRIDSPFTPDINSIQLGVRKDSQEAANRLEEEVIELVSARENTNLKNGKTPIAIQTMERPGEGDFALVIGANSIEYKGKPNEQSVIAAKFKFDPLRLPTKTA